MLVTPTNNGKKSYQRDFDMARRKAEVPRIKKTMHILPETAKFIENTASRNNIFESSVIDEAIALLRKTKDANFSSVA